MNPPQVYMCPPSWALLSPSAPHPQGHPVHHYFPRAPCLMCVSPPLSLYFSQGDTRFSVVFESPHPRLLPESFPRFCTDFRLVSLPFACFSHPCCCTVSAWQCIVSTLWGVRPGLGKQSQERRRSSSVEEDRRGCGRVPHGVILRSRVLLQLPRWVASPLTPACPAPTRVIKETESERRDLWKLAAFSWKESF